MTIVLRPCAGEAELSDPRVTGDHADAMATLASQPQNPPWCGYVGWRGKTPAGFGGFKGEPDAEGVVEIGYLTFPAFEGQGVASAITHELVRIAGAGGAKMVLAHTLPAENASTAILRRTGFRQDGTAVDPDEGEVWRWALSLAGA